MDLRVCCWEMHWQKKKGEGRGCSSVNYPDSTSNMCKNNLLGMSHCSELMPLGFGSLGLVRAVSAQNTTVCFLCAPAKPCKVLRFAFGLRQ